MVSLNYSDEEFIELIKLVNDLEPYAFYIVDSFGVMKRKDLTRLFYIIENNLKDEIYIGYHAHNNMQLAYSNAQALVDIQTRRNIIIDSSIFGMGRGAGNLNTELFIRHLNDNIGAAYVIKPLLIIIDEVLNNFYNNNYWGYSLPNYLSASYNTHPDYASYLDDKKTLTVENMDEIFSAMNDEKRSSFDKSYIEELYISYMAKDKVYEEHLTEFKKIILGKKILIIAPGKSVEDEKEKIVEFASLDDVVSISINFNYQHCDTDFIFLSNLRRFKELDEAKIGRTIVTSNIPSHGSYLQTDYVELLNDIETVRDNAGMMLIKYLIKLNVKEVYIAGFDGYSHDVSQNYAEQQMAMITKNAVLDAMNYGMSTMLTEYSKNIYIEFLTEPRFVDIELS
jgi:4-hydroxy 2-oxovalerate aldolase